MKLAKAVLYSACLFVVLVATWSCQGGGSNPVAPAEPNASLQSITSEARGDGRGDGAIKVDSNCDGSGSCEDGDREDNTIAPDGGGNPWPEGTSGPAIVWINNGTEIFCTSYRYTLSDKGDESGGILLDDGSFSCSDSLRGYYWYPPAASLYGGSNSVTMTVYCNDTGDVIGSDSFRLVDNDSCEK